MPTKLYNWQLNNQIKQSKMRKIVLIALTGIAQLSYAQLVPSDVQVRYALQLLGKNLKAHQAKNIADVLDPSFHIAEYRDRDVLNVLPQLINPVMLDTVYYESITQRNGKIYAKQIAVPKSGPKMAAWVRMNHLLLFERIGHFEQLMGLGDPVFQELQPAKLLATVPIKRSSAMMFLEMGIAGSNKKYHFLFDSGAGATSISEAVAKDLKLTVNEKAIDIKTAGKGGQFKTVDSLALTVGDVKIRGKQLVVADLNLLEKTVGHKMDGIIGFDFLKDYQVAVNLDQNQLNIYNFGYFEKAEQHVLPIKLTNNIPKINTTLTINGINYNSILLFDTGAGGSIYGNYFLNAYARGLVDKLKNKKASGSASMDLSGKISKSEMGTIDAISIAGLTLKGPTIAIDVPEVQPAYGFERHGLLGMTLIGKFNFTFNYSLNYISISPNQLFTVPLVPLYALGLGFEKQGEKFLVSNIDENGLAFKAGLRNGDEIVSVNQINPTSVDEITQQLRVLAQRKINVEVNRKQQKLKLELKKLSI